MNKTSRRFNVSRRAFLTGTCAAFSVLPRRVFGGNGHVSPGSKTTLACIGVGGQGLQNMLSFLEFPEIQVVAVCDVCREGKMLGHRLIPEARMRAFGKAPKTLSRSPGHYKEFVDACRGGPAPGSNFVDHAGLLSEVCMLSNVSVRAGKKILWDGPGMKVTNDSSANDFLGRAYRTGWSL